MNRIAPPVTPPGGTLGPDATRYHGPGDPPLGPLWLVHESRVIAALAEAGGDLTAHRTVHLEGTP